ncbi:hypothetical protein [Hymenobacter negativus]|uniref:Uncharacterized protein n=1 Tax=Hymenobacter negativus TaxID=2795026 RepID=A0ABS3Q9E9_9BACT|nr:hypothetical protein [Hymenobacter negativus]MBO2007879.1 hypothetical protein [Hymenobacter negativus]
MKTGTTRGPADICLLCRERPADKRNAHIVTDFATKGLFGEKHQGKLYLMVVKGDDISFEKKTQQSTPKEDFMLCSECERRMGIVETDISNSFYRRYRKANHRADFPIVHRKLLGGNELNFLLPSKVDSLMFSLFVWMQLWRASACQHEAFKHIKLSDDQEEQLRFHLYNFLKGTKQQTLDFSASHRDSFAPFVYNAIIPQGRIRGDAQVLGMRSIYDGPSMAYVAGLLVFYHFGLAEVPRMGFNDGSRSLEIPMVTVKQWDQWKMRSILPSSYHPFMHLFPTVVNSL